MTSLHAGALLERAPGPKYVEVLQFAELAPRAPVPKASTLASWRDKLPEGFELALVAPRPAVASSKGPMQIDEDLEAGISWLVEAADALRARAIVVVTESELTTGQRDRDRLKAYFDRIPREGRMIVWSAGGLWEPDEAQRFARRLGVTCAYDPLEDEAPDEEILYARLKAVGGRKSFPEGALMDVYERVIATGAAEAYVALESPRSFKEAAKLQQIASGEAPEE